MNNVVSFLYLDCLLGGNLTSSGLSLYQTSFSELLTQRILFLKSPLFFLPDKFHYVLPVTMPCHFVGSEIK